MQRLRDATDETSHLFVPTGQYHVAVIERVDSRRSIRTVIPLGTTFAQASSAAGVAMLARGPDEQVDEAIAVARNTSDPRSSIDLDMVKEQVEAVRRKGYSCRSGWDRDMKGIGAAILGYGGDVVAGLSVSIPLSRYQRSKEKTWGSQVIEAATAISRSLGHQGSLTGQRLIYDGLWFSPLRRAACPARSPPSAAAASADTPEVGAAVAVGAG